MNKQIEYAAQRYAVALRNMSEDDLIRVGTILAELDALFDEMRKLNRPPAAQMSLDEMLQDVEVS